MTSLDLQQLLPIREGYRLVGEVPVAIPVSRVHLTVLVEEHSQILDSTRHLMAFIDEGIETAEQLARMLGLGESLMEVVIQQAYTSGFVFPMSDGTVALTARGREALAETTRLEVSTDTVEIGVDRMTGRAFPWPGVHRDLKIKQAQLNASRRLERWQDFRTPREPPTLDQLAEVEAGTSRVVAEMLSSSRKPRRFVEVVAIEGNVERFYRTDAIAMRVAPLDGGDREWDFLVSGQLSEAHAQAFLVSQSRRTRTLLPEPPPDPLDDFEPFLEPEQLGHIDSAVRERLAERSVLERKRQDLTTRSETAPQGTDTSEVEAALQHISERIDNAQSFDALDLPEVLEVHDHRPFLLAQIRSAQHRVLIVSPWVTKNGFDRDVESALRDALDRGVHVFVRYGFANEGVSPGILNRLENLARSHHGFDHRDLGNSHVKLFAVDDRFVAGGSFNWLSFEGSPERTFRDEVSFVIQEATIIDSKFAQYLDEDTYSATAPPTDQVSAETAGVVFVEGWTDMRFMTIVAEAAKRQDLLEGIDIRHEPAGAKGSVGEVIAFSHNHPNTPALAVFDSDEIGQACARHVKAYAAGGKRAVVSYGDAYPSHRSDVEAEHLFAPSLVQGFVDEYGLTNVADGFRKNKKTQEMEYDINRESKDTFVEWIETNIEPQHTERWISLMELIRGRLGLEVDQGGS